MKNKIALVIQCGDGGVQWIKYFGHYFDKHWECDDFIDTIFLFESIVPEIKTDKENVYTTKTGKIPWGKCVIEGLKDTDYEYIIFFHEDYFLTGPQDADKLKHLIKIMDEHKMSLLKICGDWAGWTAAPKLHIGELSDKENIYEYSREVGYITSHQASIWRKSFLLNSIDPNESPWAHEMAGYARAKKLGKTIHAYLGEQPIPYTETITAGKSRNEYCKKFFDIEVEE